MEYKINTIEGSSKLDPEISSNKALKNSKISKRKKLDSKLENFLANSSAHGLSHLVSDKPLLVKVIWMISILASFICGLIFIVFSIYEYFHYDVVTNIRIRDVYSLEYPAVTFCAYNSVNSSIQEDLNEDLNIKKCRFNGNLCDMSYFKEVQSLQAGQYQTCLQFNGKHMNFHQTNSFNATQNKKFLNSTRAGFSQSLIVKFDLPPHLLLYFSVQNNDQLPIYRNFGTQLKAGKTHYDSLDKVVRKTLGKPFNDCVENSEKIATKFHNKNFTQYSYRRDNCFEFCFHENYKQKCNCSLSFSEENDFGLERCVRYSDCYRDFLKSFDFDDYCQGECPKECDHVDFKITYDSEFDITVPGLMYNWSNVSEYYSKKELNRERNVYLYYQDLKYTEIVEIPKISKTNLISNIGGILGLFLGLSILSLIELLELISLIKIVPLKKKLLKKSHVSAKSTAQ